MMISYGSAPAPSPSTSTVKLSVTMTDSYGDGWGGLTFGLKQNGVNVATFGFGFSTGKLYGPLMIEIPAQVITQVVVAQFASFGK